MILDVVNPLNILLAALFAAGLFAFVAGMGYQSPVHLSEVEKIFGDGQDDPTLMQQLQRELDAARFNITASEFMRVSIVLAVLVGLGTYLASGAWLAGLVGLVLGGMSFWLYLASKAAKALEAYEDELPQVVARLISGAKMGNSLTLAAEHVAKFGPLNCRDDWAYIAAQLKAKADVDQVLKVVSQKRGSQLLNSVFELLLVQQQRGTGLSDILPLIQESLEERVRTVRKARSKMNGPIRELWIVCATPFVGVALLRVMSPQFASIYSTWKGQLILLVGWGITISAFVIAYRSFSQALRKETNVYGVLKTEPRTPLTPISGKARPAVKMEMPGDAPSALASMTADPTRRPS